jgi:uncharacterized membrane protein
VKPLIGKRSLVLQLSVAASFAALYAVAVIVLAPISYSVVQVRLADALIPLSIVYGLPVVYGVTLGNIVANLYGGYGPVDVMFGTLANLLASYLAFRLRARPFLGCFTATLIVSFIVGGYLSILLNLPIVTTLLGLFVGSFVSIAILGYLLQRLLSLKSKNT